MILEAKEGYTFTNGEAYGKKVYLGVNDSVDNWCEIPDSEVPPAEYSMEEEMEDMKNALHLLGVE